MFTFGYLNQHCRRPDLETAIVVTAKWTCSPGDTSHLEDLAYWWQRVGGDAHSMGKGLLRFRCIASQARMRRDIRADVAQAGRQSLQGLNPLASARSADLSSIRWASVIRLAWAQVG